MFFFSSLFSVLLLNYFKLVYRKYLISSLLGKALRTLVDIARLAERFKMALRYLAQPGKLDIKRRAFGITHCFTLQTSNYDGICDFCIDAASLATSFKKCIVIMT